MFRIIPIRTSMWRAGWAILTLSLIAAYFAASTDRLTSPGIELVPPSNGRWWGALVLLYAIISLCGWLSANSTWSKWRERGLARPVAVAQAPATRVRLTWTMMQLFVGVLFLVVGILLSLAVAASVDDEGRLIFGVAVALGTIGVNYLILARRIAKLERDSSSVYFWRGQPGIVSFDRDGVYAVPAYAVLW